MPVEPFVASGTPPRAGLAPLWIAFRGDDVFLDDGTVLVESLDAIEPSPIRTLFIGTLGERPVFVAEAQGNEPDPRFVSLRAALMSVSRELFGMVSLAAQCLRFERTHVFCGRCGRETIDKPGDRAKTCASCGLHVYPPVSPAIIVLVHDDRRLLLAHRPRMPFFSLVAGFVESGESFEETLVREVREEIGLRVGDLQYFGSQPWPFPHQIMVGFYARWTGGDIAVDGVEVDEARWFEADGLPALPPAISIARAMIDSFVARTSGSTPQGA